MASSKGLDDGASTHFVHTYGNLTVPPVSILLTINKIILGLVRVWIVGSSIIKRAAMSAVSRRGRGGGLILILRILQSYGKDIVAYSYKTLTQGYQHY